MTGMTKKHKYILPEHSVYRERFKIRIS